jgi:hypothetical protein
MAQQWHAVSRWPSVATSQDSTGCLVASRASLSRPRRFVSPKRACVRGALRRLFSHGRAGARARVSGRRCTGAVRLCVRLRRRLYVSELPNKGPLAKGGVNGSHIHLHEPAERAMASDGAKLSGAGQRQPQQAHMVRAGAMARLWPTMATKSAGRRFGFADTVARARVRGAGSWGYTGGTHTLRKATFSRKTQ